MGTTIAAFMPVYLWTFPTHYFCMTFTKKIKKPLILLHFFDTIFFIQTDGEDLLRLFQHFARSTVNMKSVIKFELSQSSKLINFLEVCITLNQQTLSTTVFSKPTDTPIYLNPKFCHPNHTIKNIPKSQFLRLHKICSNKSDYIRKNNEYLNKITMVLN